MASVSGQGTTYGLPNYHGTLIALTPSETPFLSAAGGLGAGEDLTVGSVAFEWQTYDLRSGSNRARLEGANAPTAEARVRANKSNVVQIFQEAVETSYTKQAATRQYATPSSAPYMTYDGAENPVRDEHAWQVMQALKEMALDVNYCFWHGTKVVPTDNSTARATQGLIGALSSNVFVKSGNAKITGASSATDTITSSTHGLAVGDKVVFTAIGAASGIALHRAYWVQAVPSGTTFKVSATQSGSAITLGTSSANLDFFPLNAADTVSKDDVNALVQSAYDNGGITDQATATLWVNSGLKIGVSKAYASSFRQADPVRGKVGGVVVDTIETDFGTLNVALDRDLPADAMVVASMEQIRPRFLPIPGKGVLFEEPLAKVGAADRSQLYGEIGLEWGNEAAHGISRGFFA